MVKRMPKDAQIQLPMQLIEKYTEVALRRAIFKRLVRGEWFAKVPGFQGVWAVERSREQALEKLREVVLDWTLLKIEHRDRDLPVVEGIDLNVLRSPVTETGEKNMDTSTRTDATKISTTTTASDDQRDPDWEGFKGFVEKIAVVPKEELDEQRAKHEREKSGKGMFADVPASSEDFARRKQEEIDLEERRP